MFFLVFILAVMYLDVSHRVGRVGSAVKVAYIDPLYAESPGFYEDVDTLFSADRYVFEPTIGDAVTVEHLRRIPKGYDLIILRVHSTVNEDMVWFFTGEEYSQDKYVLEQLVDEVHPARPSLGSERLFAVGADFVNHFMVDRFRGSVVMVMGCDGIRSTDLAEAFVDNGARLYISWDGPVTLEHTDRAFRRLIVAVVEEGVEAEEAVSLVMEEVGCDPDYNSSIAWFPP